MSASQVKTQLCRAIAPCCFFEARFHPHGKIAVDAMESTLWNLRALAYDSSWIVKVRCACEEKHWITPRFSKLGDAKL